MSGLTGGSFENGKEIVIKKNGKRAPAKKIAMKNTIICLRLYCKQVSLASSAAAAAA